MQESSIPLYLSIKNSLVKEIQEGNYAFKDKLPTEVYLMNTYSVSRTTLRQAMRLLADEGYVKKIQGSGTYVIYRKDNELLKRSTAILSFSEEMILKQSTQTTKVITFHTLTANKSMVDELEIKEGDLVYYFERIRYSNNQPLCYEYSYMPAKPYPDLSIHHLETSKYNYIENIKGKQISHSHQTVSAILSTEKLETLLHLKKHSPLLKIENKTYLLTNELLDFTTILFSSDYYEAHFIKCRSLK